MKPTCINITSGTNTYPIHIATGLISRLSSLVDQTATKGRRFIVSNSTIWRIHGQTISTALPDAETILIPDGERFKTLHTVSRIYESLIRAGADRQATLVAVGGGIVGDVAGFAAATFLRAVSYTHLRAPET